MGGVLVPLNETKLTKSVRKINFDPKIVSHCYNSNINVSARFSLNFCESTKSMLLGWR